MDEPRDKWRDGRLSCQYYPGNATFFKLRLHEHPRKAVYDLIEVTLYGGSVARARRIGDQFVSFLYEALAEEGLNVHE